MALTSLEIKDKSFNKKIRGYDVEEVDEFLDIIVRDYEDLVRDNHNKDARIRNLEERLTYFDEMKDSLSQSVLIAQDTAEKLKQAAQEKSDNILRQADQEAQHLLDHAKFKANEILRQSTDNAKKVAIETEELKNKARVFHQRLKSTIESLRPTATYLQTSDDAFKEVVQEALGEAVTPVFDDESEVTRQFSPEEIADLQQRIAEANGDLSETKVMETVEESTEEKSSENVDIL